MRQIELLRMAERTKELLHTVGWLEEGFTLEINQGSRTHGIPWGLTVVNDRGERESAHPVLSYIGNGGYMGENKREMGQILGHINAMLLAFAREKERIERTRHEK